VCHSDDAQLPRDTHLRSAVHEYRLTSGCDIKRFAKAPVLCVTEKNKQRRRMGAPARAYNHHIASWAVDQGCKQSLIQFVAERASMLVSAALRVNCQSGDSCVGDRKRIIHSMYAPLGETLTLRTVFFLHRRWRRSSEFLSQDSNSVAHQTRRLCTADLSFCRAAPNTSSAAW
jgi:hypothetical protein